MDREMPTTPKSKMSVVRAKSRSVHRTLGYFYLGLILSFSVSGIAMNHRESWDPMSYEYETQKIQTEFNLSTDILESEVEAFVDSELSMSKGFRGHEIEHEDLLMFFEEGMFEVNLNDGQGTLRLMRMRPILGQMTLLHKSTQSFWIWYSDVFAGSMILLGLTSIVMMRGNNSFFSGRGWMLSVAGLVIPLIILFWFA